MKIGGRTTTPDCCPGETARVAAKRRPQGACALLSVLLCSYATYGQDRRPSPLSNSDLGRANLNRVSASAGEIKVVLIKDPGLMVELKRWVAKDATDHGQILRDEDMTDDSIFDRLTADIQFRSIATQLVQRYGYLVPKLNPDSDAGKEHELLVQERVKWAAQHAEEGRAKAHARKEEALEKARACEEQDEQLCADLQRSSRPSPRAGYEQGQDQDNGTGDLPSRTNPTYPDLTSPSPGTTGALERAQLMQTSGDGSEIPQLSGGELLGSGGSPGGVMLPGMTPDLMQQRGGGGTTGLSLGAGASAGTRSGGNLELQSALLGLSANDSGSDAPTFDVLEANHMSNSAVSPPFRNSPDGAGQPFSEPSKRKETLQPAAMIRQPSPYNNIPSLYEMYVQAVPRPDTPRRFGVDVF